MTIVHLPTTVGLGCVGTNMLTSIVAVSLFVGSLLPSYEPTTIKAEIVGPYFVVPADANGRTIRLLIDSGAGMNVLQPSVTDRLGILGGTPIDANGVGSSTVKAKIVTLDWLKIGTAELKKPQAVAIDLPADLEIDGLVGHGFFSRFVIGLDYEHGVVTITPPSEFQRPYEYAVLPLRVYNNLPQIPMKVDGEEVWVTVDTGSTDTLTLFDSFVESRQLRTKIPNLKPTASSGVGGIATGERGKMKGLTLAGFELPELSVTLSRQKKGAFSNNASSGNLGADILRRFTVVLDYTNGKAYFKKNARFGVPEYVNRLGITVNLVGQRHQIAMVFPGSPAEKAGIKTGEAILALNGNENPRTMDIWAAIRQPAGTKVALKLRSKEGEVREVELVCSDESQTRTDERKVVFRSSCICGFLLDIGGAISFEPSSRRSFLPSLIR